MFDSENVMYFSSICARRASPVLAAAGLAISLLSACGGGGGGGGGGSGGAGPVEPEATVTSVTIAAVLEGNAGLQPVLLTVTLDKPLLAAATLRYSTASTAKAGVPVAAGFAVGGAACGVGVDYIAAAKANPAQVVVAAGQQTASVALPIVCGDRLFEPNETFTIEWSMGDKSGSNVATIVNDDAGGLNSPGVTNVLGGAAAFGRDTNALTNSAADGSLGFSFATTAGGCRADQVTGLVWGTLDNALVQPAGFAAVLAAANGAGLCGFNDWRLPSAEELASLVDASKAAAPINADSNATTQMSGDYWSAHARVGSANDHGVVAFSSLGAVGFLNRNTGFAKLRLVRGAALVDPCDGVARYSEHGDGTVSDAKTGLMWMQCPQGLSGAGCAVGGAFSTAQIGSVDAVTRLNLVNTSAATLGLGYSDWRIPSRNELSSLVCRAGYAGGEAAINSTVFPANGLFSYLSSTLHGAIANAPWYVDFADGSVAAISNANKRLRLVRAGQ